ncbi:NAD(+) diphosphatase [Ostreibacterium oceani]|uniref:NAD(+) diphosphatase n=1 Tax=Ostreibacterium oceani TaxID=2654998 RepID=A0A6N7F1G8_9GAMM|nr:NAD(+) diphosphatase [Ostreibacterium oceani]MPV86638.1 NAD(+) diphosphatase [Ostreibacterium oceani]
MKLNNRQPPLLFCGSPLNRSHNDRYSATELSAMYRSANARITLLYQSQHVIAGDTIPVASVTPATPTTFRATFSYAELPPAIQAITPFALLGYDNNAPYFAINIAVAKTTHETDTTGELARVYPWLQAHTLLDLRAVSAIISAHEAAILAHARALFHWQQTHQFCGACGATTHLIKGGHAMRCLPCGQRSYPRTDSTIIVLVERIAADGQPECLLASHAKRKSGNKSGQYFSLLAGFVEPGETLEEAVYREVFEETGIRVSAVQYQGSQPWPFPNSLMLGFRAMTAERAIHLNKDELTAAKWFDKAAVRQLAANDQQMGSDRCYLPNSQSIARQLIDAWLHE